MNAAAPNPQARANYSESHAADLFNKYLEKIRGPGGGTGGYGGPSSGTVPRGTNPFSTSLPTSDYPTSGQVDQAQWQNDPFAADFKAYDSRFSGDNLLAPTVDEEFDSFGF